MRLARSACQSQHYPAIETGYNYRTLRTPASGQQAAEMACTGGEDIRSSAIGVIVDAAPILTVRLLASLLDGLVPTDIQPGSVSEHRSTSAEGICDRVHGTAVILADRVLCYLAA